MFGNLFQPAGAQVENLRDNLAESPDTFKPREDS